MAGPWEDGIAAYKDGDYATALQLWRPLAEQGDPRAENNLGVLYEKGLGVPVDLERAASWYRRSAAQGHEGGLIDPAGRLVVKDSGGAAFSYAEAQRFLEELPDRSG